LEKLPISTGGIGDVVKLAKKFDKKKLEKILRSELQSGKNSVTGS